MYLDTYIPDESVTGNIFLLIVADYFTIGQRYFYKGSRSLDNCIYCFKRNCHFISQFIQIRKQILNFFFKYLFLCKRLGIDFTHTTPLHPQSDGMVEHFNHNNRLRLQNLLLLNVGLFIIVNHHIDY